MATRATTNRKPMTRAEAEILSSAVVRQMAARIKEFENEGNWALGGVPSDKFNPPPAWVGAAIRVLFTGRASPVQKKPVSSTEVIGSLGAVMGVSKMWNAVLDSPPVDVAELEKDFGKLSEIRGELAKLTAPFARKVAKAEKRVDRLAMKPELQLAYLSGKKEGASSLLSENGTMTEESAIRPTICYFLWLYWPEIQRLSTASQLMEFFQQMRQEDVTKKNLEKVCREIGLSFKRRGRPKNLLRKGPK